MKDLLDDTKNDFVETMRPGGKPGIRVSKNIYEHVVAVIITEIRKKGNVTFTELLDVITKHMTDHLNIQFIALQVKLDLEGKGFLKSVRSPLNPQRTQISITRRGRSQFAGIKGYDGLQ